MWNHRMSMCDIFFNIVKLTALQTVDNTGKTCRLYAHCARWIFMSKSKNPVRKPFPIFWRRRSKGVVVFALNMGHSDSYIWLGDEVKFCCWWRWFFKGCPVLVSLMLMLYAHWSGKSGRVPAITSGGKPAGKNQDLNLSWVGLSGDECAAQWEASGAGWGSASWGGNFQLFSTVPSHSKLGKCVENYLLSTLYPLPLHLKWMKITMVMVEMTFSCQVNGEERKDLKLLLPSHTLAFWEFPGQYHHLHHHHHKGAMK